MMSKLAARALIDWVPVSPRIITARFNSKGRKVTLINCYAPTNNTTDELKQEFYDSLQGVLDHTPRRDIRILMGNLNAKIGSDNTGRERFMESGSLTCALSMTFKVLRKTRRHFSILSPQKQKV